MRTKDEILKECGIHSDRVEQGLILEVLLDIRNEFERIADILDEVRSPAFNDRDASIRVRVIER